MANVILSDAPDWQLLLAGRIGGSLNAQPSRLKLLPQDMVSFDALAGDAPRVDVGKMAVTVCISTSGLDQSRDIVVGNGIDTAIHARNPLALFMHKATIPIGRAFSQDTGYTVQVGDEKTFATTYFFQNSPEAEQVFRLIEIGALPGASVGIRPKPGLVKQANGDDGHPYCVIEGCTLVEYSHVFFPDNPDALVVAVQKGLGKMAPSLRECLLPLMPAPKATLLLPNVQNTVQKTVPKLILRSLTMASPNKITPKRLPAPRVRRKDSAAGAASTPPPTAAGNAPETAEDTPKIPVGAEFGAALYEMTIAMAEFIDGNSGMLEPEAAESYSGVYEFITNMQSHVSDAYAARYPDLPALGANEGDLADDEEEDVADDGEVVEATTDSENEPVEVVDDEVDESSAEMEDDDEDDDTEERAAKYAAAKLKEIARNRVRTWWKMRQKRLTKAEKGVVKETADFLDECSKHSGPWGRVHKAACAFHAKSLIRLGKAMADDDGENDGMPKSADDDVLTKLLTEREQMIKNIGAGAA